MHILRRCSSLAVAWRGCQPRCSWPGVGCRPCWSSGTRAVRPIPAPSALRRERSSCTRRSGWDRASHWPRAVGGRAACGSRASPASGSRRCRGRRTLRERRRSSTRHTAARGSRRIACEPLLRERATELGGDLRLATELTTQLYRSTAILGAGDELPPALRPEQWAGQPGTRAPHLWMTRGDARVSTLDLFQHGWMLLTEDERWCPAAAQASDILGITLECLRIGVDVLPVDPAAFRTAFGLGLGGATLVRPDGYVAGRAADRPADPARRAHRRTRAGVVRREFGVCDYPGRFVSRANRHTASPVSRSRTARMRTRNTRSSSACGTAAGSPA